jgi:hypothetical protein
MMTQQAFPDSPFHEEEEMELAAELLAANNDQELDHFLGRMMRRSHSRFGRRLGAGRMRSLGGWLKGAVRRIFPRSHRHRWRFQPNMGGYDPYDQDDSSGYDPYSPYSQLGQDSGEVLGLEMEGLSPEDREFNAARKLVRLAGTAASEAAAIPQSTPPEAAAEQAVAHAAQIHAPGLLRTEGSGEHLPEHAHHHHGHHSREGHHAHDMHDIDHGEGKPHHARHHHYQTGQWVRHGHRIILHGL